MLLNFVLEKTPGETVDMDHEPVSPEFMPQAQILPPQTQVGECQLSAEGCHAKEEGREEPAADRGGGLGHGGNGCTTRRPEGPEAGTGRKSL